MLIYDRVMTFWLLSSHYTRLPLSAISTGQVKFSRSAVLVVSAVVLTQLLVLSEYGVLWGEFGGGVHG